MPRRNPLTYTTALAFGMLLWAGASIAGTAPVYAQAGCSAASFAPATNFAAGSAPISVAAGDFNGDGNTDLVTANLNSNNVSILLGNGAGGFTGPVNFPAGTGPNSVGVADFNGDGKLDLAVANQIVGAGTVSILNGAGDGTFSAPAGFTAGSFPRDLTVGDFNGDGKSDVAVANSQTNEIRVLPGTGTGSLGAPVVTTAAASGFSGVFELAVGDFNGDGKSDLVGLREKNPQPPFGPGAISILLGTGTGSFTTGETRPAGINPSFATVASLNGDAFSDLVVVNRASATISLLHGAGDGSFPTSQTIATGGIPESVTVADFNLDGKNDLAVARQAGSDSSVVMIYLGDGAGGFNLSGDFAIGTVPFGSLVADFDKDGKPDIATANFTSNNVSVLINGCGAATAQVSLQFQQPTYVTSEAQTVVSVLVTRTGLVDTPVTVDYRTVDGTATERGDYTTTLGTLRFGQGETSKTFRVLISDDSLVEGSESFTLALSNPTGGAALGAQAAATIQIADNGSEPSRNIIDDAETFVGQHYHDFLNRQADFDGLSFWREEIWKCGSDAGCVDVKRTNVSQAFFLSIEFQRTGYQVIRFYKASFAGAAPRPRGLPLYTEFLRDTQELQRGVIVGQAGWEQQLQQNTQEFARRWVAGAEFSAQFPADMTVQQFVEKLFANSGVTPTTTERDAAIAAYGAGGTDGRAAALLSVTDSGSVYNRQFNLAAVLMQYFGYLRRNPSDPPEATLDFAGYDFWLAKLDSFSLPGEDVRNEETARNRLLRAEMVRAFILSDEYRKRFGQ
jgi:hypothetical protein